MDESIWVMIYEELQWCWRLPRLHRRPCVLGDLQPREVRLLPGDLWMNNNPIKVLLRAMGKRFYIISLKFESKRHVVPQHLIGRLSASFITGTGGG